VTAPSTSSGASSTATSTASSPRRSSSWSAPTTKELEGAVYQCTAPQTADGVKAIVTKLKEKCPGAKILVLAIFPRGATPTDKFRQQNEETNAIIKNLADNKTVFFLDINAKFLEADGTLSKDIMPDLLHPNDKGYEIWAEAIAPKVKELLK
jgi:lysophospholipase L1-like esterase